MAFGYTGNIRKDPANAAIERNITHLADFLCPPAEWAMKLKEKGFLNSDTFDRAVNDSNTDSQKKKATLMIIDIQRCIKVNDPNAFGTLVYMTQQDQHGTAISKKLIGSYKANGGGKEIDDYLTSLSLDFELIDSPSEQSLPVRRRYSSQPSAQHVPINNSSSQSSLGPESLNSTPYQSILQRPHSTPSLISEVPSIANSTVMPDLSSSETSSDDEIQSDAELASSSKVVAAPERIRDKLLNCAKCLIDALDKWKVSLVLKCLFLLEVVYANIWTVLYVCYQFYHKTEVCLLDAPVVLCAGSILLASLFGIFYGMYYLGVNRLCLKNRKYCKTNWRGKHGQHITRRKYWERIENSVVCLQSDGSTFSGFVVKLTEDNVVLITRLRCFQTPTEQQTENSEPQWKSICRRIRKCSFKFHFISSSSCQELNGKDLIWLGTTDKKNLFAEPEKDLLAVRLNPKCLPQCVTPLDAGVMRSYLKHRSTSDNSYWLKCHVTILGHSKGGPLCQSGGKVVHVCQEGDGISYKARTEEGHAGSPVVLTMTKKDKTRPVVIAVHLDTDAEIQECNKGRLLWPFLDDVCCQKTTIAKCIST